MEHGAPEARTFENQNLWNALSQIYNFGMRYHIAGLNGSAMILLNHFVVISNGHFALGASLVVSSELQSVWSKQIHELEIWFC